MLTIERQEKIRMRKHCVHIMQWNNRNSIQHFIFDYPAYDEIRIRSMTLQSHMQETPHLVTFYLMKIRWLVNKEITLPCWEDEKEGTIQQQQLKG